ncbi:MAG: IPT/TIG domain-containing protein [Bacteroidia bacterium]
MSRYRALLFLTVCCFIFSCKPDVAVPKLEHLSPSEGEAGTAVRVYGKALENTVDFYFDGKRINHGILGADSLNFIVPQDAVPGTYPIHAKGVNGESNSMTFRVIKPRPVIQDIVPAFGMVGDTVTITGSNFGTDNTSVIFHNAVSTGDFLESGESMIRLRVPEGAEDGEVFVEDDGLRSAAGFPFDVIEDPENPLITAIIPAQALREATVTIQGINLDGSQVFVFFPGEKTGIIQTRSATAIEVVVPEDAVFGEGKVRVEVDNQVSNEFNFTVLEPARLPEIDRIEPDRAALGDLVTIHGSMLSGSSVAVMFYQQPAPASALGAVQGSTDSTIIVRVPNAADDGNVRVEVDGIRSRNAVFFDVISKNSPCPAISSLDADSLGFGNRFGINGSNFSGSQHEVFFRQNGNIVPGAAFPCATTASKPSCPEACQQGRSRYLLRWTASVPILPALSWFLRRWYILQSPQPAYTGDMLRLQGDFFVREEQ